MPLLFHRYLICNFFFFNDTATTEIYTLSLHDALPICRRRWPARARRPPCRRGCRTPCRRSSRCASVAQCVRELLRSEEHTSELQSQSNIVCRLLLEKKNIPTDRHIVPMKLDVGPKGTD